MRAAISASDEIVVAQVVPGGVQGGARLRVVRSLKGKSAPGSQLDVHLAADSVSKPGGIFREPCGWPLEKLTALWFLRGDGSPYAAVPVTPFPGRLECASLWLPDESPGEQGVSDPGRAAGAEIAAALRSLAAAQGAEIKQSATAMELADALATLGDPLALAAIYRELAADGSGYCRGVGIAGLIAVNDPEGPKRAVRELRTLTQEADVYRIITNLSRYNNASDAGGVRAIARLATEFEDLNMPNGRSAAAYALRAIHTKEAMPGLIRLLDTHTADVRSDALAGICSFVRSAMRVEPDAPWMHSKAIDPHCWPGGTFRSGDVAMELVAFWKAWWRDHEHEVMQ